MAVPLIVELRNAFTWDCQTCGEIQFERVTPQNIREEIAKEVDAEEEPDPMAETILASIWFVDIPLLVTCKRCGASFATRYFEDDEEGDFDPFEDEQ